MKTIHPINYANVVKVVDFIQKFIEEPATRIRRKCNWREIQLLECGDFVVYSWLVKENYNVLYLIPMPLYTCIREASSINQYI